MTWDEAELRAALREGEGETLSAGHIAALGQARQQRRHDRLRTLAVAVVVTGLLGGGVGALSQLNGDSESAGSASANGAKAVQDYGKQAGVGVAQAPDQSMRAGAPHEPQPLAPVPSSGGGGYATASGLLGGGTSGGSAVGCPDTPSAATYPTPNESGSAGPLFAEPVASITVCGYRAGKSGRTYTLRGSTNLTGGAARNVAADLERTPRITMTVDCAGSPSARLTIHAVSATGRPLPVVTVDAVNGCAATVTNGTVVRYGWDIPKALEALTH